jgi:RHH-type proline utilization regulon transcriptional repressor/proline dehydrogenase/delta 1-pyrroline-5-carboxylate dehydrogenase
VDDSLDEAEVAVARLAAETVGTPVEVVDHGELVSADLAGVTKVRLLGHPSPEVYAAVHGAGVTVDDNPVVDRGRIELPRWTREQAVSRTRHRYGTVIS